MTKSSSVSKKPTRIVIIGGGATGVGIAREASERGYSVTLVDRGKLGMGTSGHFHGMLHSGARYAVNDITVAAECYEENQRLRKHIPEAIIDTGGMFVAMNAKEAEHASRILSACSKAGIPTEEISTEHALALEPQLNPALMRAFLVPDAFINGAKLINLNRAAAESGSVPAKFIEDHAITRINSDHNNVRSVEVSNVRTGQSSLIECDYLINASGVWSGAVAGLAGVSIGMIFDKGTMIAFEDKLTSRVVNRSRSEGDGDLLVPDSLGRSVLGTTARVVPSPDDNYPTQEEVDVLMREGVAMIPALASSNASRVFTGVRPLFDADGLKVEGSTRAVSRSYHVIDHSDQALDNFMSIVGGKVTLYRRMAEDAINLLDAKLTG